MSKSKIVGLLTILIAVFTAAINILEDFGGEEEAPAVPVEAVEVVESVEDAEEFEDSDAGMDE